MPTYEYECKSCAYTFEAFQSMSDEPLKDCPQCGHAVRRLICGGTGVIFKGSGFYVTDKSKGTGSESSKQGKGSAANGSASALGSGAAPGSASTESPAASAPTTAAKQEGATSGDAPKSAAKETSSHDKTS